MLFRFYTDPVNLDNLCEDLTAGIITVIETTRPNFRKLDDVVTSRLPELGILNLSAEDKNHEWHHYFINTSVVAFSTETIPPLVVQATEAWDAAGSQYGRLIEI